MIRYVAIYRAHEKVTIVNQQEVLPLTNVDVKTRGRKSAPGKDIRTSHVEVILTVEAGDREIPGLLLAIPVAKSHLKLSADNRQHQRAKFRALEHLLSAID